MDRKLDRHPLDADDRANHDLLALSATFESSLKEQAYHPYRALEVLSPLAEITRASLLAVSAQKSASQPAHFVAHRPPLSQKSARKEPNVKDALALLQSLRQSGRSFRKTPPHCTTILKAPQK